MHALIPATDLLNNNNSHENAVQEINSFFANAGKLLADKIRDLNISGGTHSAVADSHIPRVTNSMVLLPPDEHEIDSLIMNLKNVSAPGWDGIPNKEQWQTSIHKIS